MLQFQDTVLQGLDPEILRILGSPPGHCLCLALGAGGVGVIGPEVLAVESAH